MRVIQGLGEALRFQEVLTHSERLANVYVQQILLHTRKEIHTSGCKSQIAVKQLRQ